MAGSIGQVGRFALAIETSGAIGSVAVGCSEAGRRDPILGVISFTRPRAHAIEFFSAIQLLCSQNHITPSELNHIYVSSGPGSFTGLRIGITAARTLAWATGAKIVSIPTLQVIAQGAMMTDQPPDQVAVLLDAKRGHVYAAAFKRTRDSLTDTAPGTAAYAPICEPAEADPGAFLAVCDRNCAVMGEGVLYHLKAVADSGLRVLPEESYRPRAEIVFALGIDAASKGRFSEPRDLIPTYIRPPEAEEKWVARQALRKD